MNKVDLSAAQLRAAILKCHSELAQILRSVQAENAGATTIGQRHRASFHDIVVHASGLFRGPHMRGTDYRAMIARAYANSVHLKERAPTIESVQIIMTLLAVAAASAELHASARPPGSAAGPPSPLDEQALE